MRIVDDYKFVTVDVDEIDDDIVYSKGKGDDDYELPDDDDIIMLYISNYEEVDTAYLTIDGKKVVGAILEGTPTVYLGRVTLNSWEYKNIGPRYQMQILWNMVEPIPGSVMHFARIREIA